MVTWVVWDEHTNISLLKAGSGKNIADALVNDATCHFAKGTSIGKS